MIDRGLNAPSVRGIGRYFDAVGALVLGRPRASYEGQVAIAWNVVADPNETGHYPFALHRTDAPKEVDLRPMVRAVVGDILSGVSEGTISAKFHNTLIRATGAVVRDLVEVIGRPPVLLTGGVFQNALLSEGLVADLSNDFQCFTHGEVPPGDGGIALGQALVADAIVRQGAAPCA